MTSEPVERRSADGEEPAAPPSFWWPHRPDILDLLARADITKCDLLPWGSNYTFLVELDAGDGVRGLAVYKPRRGEAPLYDFPDGTLYRREFAAYVVSEAIGWQLVPPTVIRDGPYGVGTAQLFIDAQPKRNYFTLREDRSDDLKPMAAFDVFANNADRKGAHCLLDPEDRIWGIDHGLTFNVDYKLRTVIWDFSGQPVSPALQADMQRLLEALQRSADPYSALSELLAPHEISILCRRLEAFLELGEFPHPGPRRGVPWPPM